VNKDTLTTKQFEVVFGITLPVFIMVSTVLMTMHHPHRLLMMISDP